MKALMKLQEGPEHVALQEKPAPIAQKGEVLVKIMAAGICGTDLKIRAGQTWSNPPVVLGHEVSGIICALGEDVDGVQIGDRVVCETAQVICGDCYYCHSGHDLMCDKRLSIGYGVDGGMAEYMVARKGILHALPHTVSFSNGAVCEPLAVAVHAVYDTVPVKSTDIALVSGCGAIGLLVAQVVRSLGARVIMTGLDVDIPRLQLAKTLGVEYTVNVETENLQQRVKEVTDGMGVDLAYDCSGSAAAIRGALQSLKKRGQMVQIGLTKPDLEIPYSLFTGRELRLFGTFGHNWVSWEQALKLIATDKVKISPLVTHHFLLDDWERAFAVAENREGIKVMLHPNGLTD